MRPDGGESSGPQHDSASPEPAAKPGWALVLLFGVLFVDAWRFARQAVDTLKTPYSRDYGEGCVLAMVQLLAEKDSRYHELLAATDPFPYNPGEKRGLLVDAAVGKGSWSYVGLALFRQVPAGVPGAWRLLANLVSRPRPSTGPAREAGAR